MRRTIPIAFGQVHTAMATKGMKCPQRGSRQVVSNIATRGNHVGGALCSEGHFRLQYGHSVSSAATSASSAATSASTTGACSSTAAILSPVRPLLSPRGRLLHDAGVEKSTPRNIRLPEATPAVRSLPVRRRRHLRAVPGRRHRGPVPAFGRRPLGLSQTSAELPAILTAPSPGPSRPRKDFPVGL